MIPKFLRSEGFPYASVTIVPARQFAPRRYRDLTAENMHDRCVCTVEYQRHFDGWDGNRLDCEEAARRHGVAVVSTVERTIEEAQREPMTRTLDQVICAWCADFDGRATKNRGVSHGLCEDCRARLEAEDRDARDGDGCSRNCGYCGRCN